MHSINLPDKARGLIRTLEMTRDLCPKRGGPGDRSDPLEVGAEIARIYLDPPLSYVRDKALALGYALTPLDPAVDLATVDHSRTPNRRDTTEYGPEMHAAEGIRGAMAHDIGGES